jgi:branched-chain amino acid transport system ATP-binding protein
MLSLENVDVYYKELQALWGISLTVGDGEIISLIGPNGAGKTTTLRIISGLHRPASGEIRFTGQLINKVSPDKIVELGLSQVPETGQIFTAMSVLENLELGAFVEKARKDRAQSLARVFEIFPRLAERKEQQAGTLSGGERQMLAIGRALIVKINQQGVAILLVEQNVQAALEIAHRAYLLENGRIVGQGDGKQLLSFESVRSSYLG